jgi:hypothetical protein
VQDHTDAPASGQTDLFADSDARERRFFHVHTARIVPKPGLFGTPGNWGMTRYVSHIFPRVLIRPLRHALGRTGGRASVVAAILCRWLQPYIAGIARRLLPN